MTDVQFNQFDLFHHLSVDSIMDRLLEILNHIVEAYIPLRNCLDQLYCEYSQLKGENVSLAAFHEYYRQQQYSCYCTNVARGQMFLVLASLLA